MRKDLRDLSENKQDDIRLGALEFADVGLFQYKFDGTVVSIDAGTLHVLDLEEKFPDPAMVVGMNISDLIVYPGAPGTFRKIIRERGHVHDFEYHYKTLTGKDKWVLHDSYMVKDPETGEDMIQAIIHDITDLKKAEVALLKANRTLRVLSDVNQTLIRATDEPGLLKRVCQSIVETGGYRMVWVGYVEHDAHKTVRPVAWAGHEDGYLSAIKISWSDIDIGHGPSGRAVRTGQPAVVSDIANDPSFQPWREEALRRDTPPACRFH